MSRVLTFEPSLPVCEKNAFSAISALCARATAATSSFHASLVRFCAARSSFTRSNVLRSSHSMLSADVFDAFMLAIETLPA